MKRPKFLSRWADEHGIPRRTVYDRFRKGQLEVPATRLPSGSIVVLEDDVDAEVHPFTAAYAAILHTPLEHITNDLGYSPLLDAWGCSLYEAVRPGFRPLVLGLARSAAAHPTHASTRMAWRLLDFIAHVDLPAWHRAAGQVEAAEMLEVRGEITDQDSFHRLWPTAIPSHEWRDELDAAAAKVQQAVEDASAPSAVVSLAHNRFGIELTPVLADRITRWRSPSSAAILDKRLQDALAGTLDVQDLIPSVRDLRACYVDAIGTLGITTCRLAALAACRVAGWEPAASRPPDSHDAFRIGFEAVTEAEKSVLDPHLTDSLLREVLAFHCIATDQPLRHPGPIPS